MVEAKQLHLVSSLGLVCLATTQDYPGRLCFERVNSAEMLECTFFLQYLLVIPNSPVNDRFCCAGASYPDFLSYSIYSDRIFFI